MERSNKHRSKRDRKARKAPKVPIKTYRWEDIRRARRRGGYPWTYLYKGPYTEKIDPEQFTMDALRRAKSSSPMGRRSDRIDISEVSSWADYSGKTTPTLLQELINEPDEDLSRKGSRAGSVVIEEYVEDDERDLEDDVQVKEFHMESAESSDNISQYLDKDEQSISSRDARKRVKGSQEDVKGERAKSEETGQRKRKLSAESGHSRYSLSKLGVIKKLQEAKSKLKVPKISFPTKKMTRKRASPPKEEKSKKEPKKIRETSRLKKVDNPVYIHIPLKPPPGETDEFSYLEFEPKNGHVKKLEINDNEPKVEEGSEVTVNGTIAHPAESPGEGKMDVEPSTPEAVNGTVEHPAKSPGEGKMDVEPSTPEAVNGTVEHPAKSPGEGKMDVEPSTSEIKDKSPFSTLERGPRVTTKPPLKINPAFKQFLKDVRQLKDKEMIDAEPHPDGSKSVEEPTLPAETKATNMAGLEEPHTSDSESPKDVDFDKLFQTSFARPPEISDERTVRSKSAEPEKKRRHSLESSYSRKSLSKLAIMKKLKNASDKIKSAFSMDSLRKKVALKKEEPKEEKKAEKAKLTKVSKTTKPVEPVYIHIPLKLPEGETDEFSSLAQETTHKVKEERTDSLDSTSSNSPKSGNIQMIFLTPPSDDETLDKDPDIPETPSSAADDMAFFGSLKKLAQDAVDQVSPEAERKPLETVREESASDKGSTNDINVDAAPSDGTQDETKADNEEPSQIAESPEIAELEEKMVLDVEDGLNETPKIEEQLKSALKTAEASAPVKRVSFKRKLKAKNKQVKEENTDGGYETIESPKDAAAAEPPKVVEFTEKEKMPEVAVDVDMDELILEQSASLKEEDNQWSNAAGDHEYEPISPPEEITISTGLPNVTVVDADSDPKIVISATEILDKPADEKKKPFFQFARFTREKARDDVGKSRESDNQGRELPTESDVKGGPSKFQVALKHRTEQLKSKTTELRTKMHNIKKPNIHFPKTPEFKKPHFKKPDFKINRPKLNLHLPKIPDSATIRIPHISLPGARKITETRTIETRQHSTESTADDSGEPPKRRTFDLTFGGTFPRFRRKPKEDVSFATVPRTKKQEKQKKTDDVTVSSQGSSIRIPLHPEYSLDEPERMEYEQEADIARFSGRRHSDGIGTEDDDYERENQAINRADFLSRWQHGNFKERPDDEENEDERIVGQLVEQRFGRGAGQGNLGYEERSETLEERLRRDEERPRYIEDDEEEFDTRLMHNKHMVTDLDNLEDDHPAGHRDGYSSEGSRGSLQKKGRLGKLDIDSDEFFVVHEIREGFQTPANALAQMNEYDPIGSNRSLPMQMRPPEPMRSEVKKPIKKPKRKKTPHVSQEEIPGDEESIEEVITPFRPKRRSKRNRIRPEMDEGVIPYQETISLAKDDSIPHADRLKFPRESLGILGDDERDDHDFEPYESELLEKQEPNAPPRKHRSLKSLTQSESESILTDNRFAEDIEDQILRSGDYQIRQPPKPPSRRSRSHTSSLSRVSLPPSQRDTDSIFTDEAYLADNQQIPSYLIENQTYKQQAEAPREEGLIEPCTEAPCVQDVRDYMGYSIVDKSRTREPPLPPPRMPTKRKKRAIEPEQKFATVPRNVGLSQATPPIRPLRNYSTLSHVKSSRAADSSSLYENDFRENKENQAQSGQYIEIEDDVNRDLISGEVVQKMRQRPLPAPPRPPRKPKTTRLSLQDITSQSNIVSTPLDEKSSNLAEETVSTQTEPLPPDFICEEVKREPTDTIITPRTSTEPFTEAHIQRFQDPRIRKELITPSVYSFEETVTHGSLVVQPLDGSKVIPDHQLSRERLVPVTKEISDDDDETSEVPESFRKLTNPPEATHKVLRAEKLQVSDLDVDRLTVNQLLASKLVVSEIDSSIISTNEIQGRGGGTVKLGDVELPPHILDQLVRDLEAKRQSAAEIPTGEPTESKQKKTSINVDHSLHPQTVDLVHESSLSPLHDLSPEPPIPPPRGCTLEESPSAPMRKSRQESPRLESSGILEPEVDDDQPPPRPPQPMIEQIGGYMPSQPPASFYALRAKQFVEENIPTVAPRRKRHQRSRPVSRSRSTSDSSLAPHPRPSSGARASRRFSDTSSIPELSSRLVQACNTRLRHFLKRLIYYVSENVLRNADGNQDLHVFMIILLVLIAGLILLGYGEDRTIIHLHHWEYFNPPKDI